MLSGTSAAATLLSSRRSCTTEDLLDFALVLIGGALIALAFLTA
jgi:hypothetical protein